MSWSMAPQFVFSVGLYLLAGYLFSRISYYRRFSLEHLAAQQQSFSIFGYAVFLYLLSWFSYSLLDADSVVLLKWFEKETDVSGRALIGLFLATGLALADNVRVLILMSNDPSLVFEGPRSFARMRMAATARYVNKSDDESLRILFRATLLNKLLMVTLSNDKVYVGYITRYPANPTKQPAFLRIVPHSSGYRDSAKRVHLPVRYDSLRERIELRAADASEYRPPWWMPWLRGKTEDPKHPLYEDIATLKLSGEDTVDVDLNDFGMVIPWSEITTMTIYNEDIHRAFDAGTEHRPLQ